MKLIIYVLIQRQISIVYKIYRIHIKSSNNKYN